MKYRMFIYDDRRIFAKFFGDNKPLHIDSAIARRPRVTPVIRGTSEPVAADHVPLDKPPSPRRHRRAAAAFRIHSSPLTTSMKRTVAVKEGGGFWPRDRARPWKARGLIYRLVFEVMNLGFAYCRTCLEKGQTVSHHDSRGLERHGVLPDFGALRDLPHDAPEPRLRRPHWLVVGAALADRAQKIARMLERKR